MSKAIVYIVVGVAAIVSVAFFQHRHDKPRVAKVEAPVVVVHEEPAVPVVVAPQPAPAPIEVAPAPQPSPVKVKRHVAVHPGLVLKAPKAPPHDARGGNSFLHYLADHGAKPGE